MPPLTHRVAGAEASRDRSGHLQYVLPAGDAPVAVTGRCIAGRLCLLLIAAASKASFAPATDPLKLKGIHTKSPGLFVTGTDTNIGKTYVAAMIVRELARAGLRVGVYKPVASGCQLAGGSLVSDDALALWQAAGQPGALEAVCPQCFSAPLAPHLAAAAEGRRIDAPLLRRGLDYWLEKSDVIVVEGAGGLLSPVSENGYVADVAFDFGYPLVIVTANRLGTIHQTLATLTVAATFRGGLKIAGVVVNEPHQTVADASVQSNFDELRKRSSAPVIAQVGWQAEQFEPVIDWFALARDCSPH